MLSTDGGAVASDAASRPQFNFATMPNNIFPECQLTAGRAAPVANAQWAGAWYLGHLRRCMRDPAVLRAQALKHFQIYAQGNETFGMHEIMLSWSRLHLRLGSPWSQGASEPLVEIVKTHLGDPSAARINLNEESFELFFLKMLMTIKPPLLVAVEGESVGPEGSAPEEYRRRLQRCLLDPDQLRAQALKHFQVFGNGSSTIGLAEVTRSMFQMHVRMNLFSSVPQLESQVTELLTNHTSGPCAQLGKDGWELLYWKMLLETFGARLPLEPLDPAGETATSTNEPAEEPMPGSPGDQTDTAVAAKLPCMATTQMGPSMVGMMQPMMPMVAPHNVVWPFMQPPQAMDVSWPSVPAPPAGIRAQGPLPSSLDGGRFLVEKRLGSGSFGEVFKAKVVTTGLIVAVKRVLKQQDRMMKEFMVLRNLNHPHVLQVADHFEDEHSLYVVSEYLSGGALSDLLQKTTAPFTEGWAAEVMLQILNAMAYCHDEGVVHNDLKAQNLLLRSSTTASKPHVVVSDFGQAAAALQPGQCPTAELPLGDPRYVPPEAWDVQTCHGVCSKPGDVWMIACTMFEILSGGALPFLGRKHVSLQEFKNWCATVCGFAIKWVQCLKGGNLMWWNLCDPPRSQAAIACISQMLAKNPAHRPDCVQAADHAWFWQQCRHQKQRIGASASAEVLPGRGNWQSQLGRRGDESQSQSACCAPGQPPSGPVPLVANWLPAVPPAPMSKASSVMTASGIKPLFGDLGAPPAPPALPKARKGLHIRNQPVQNGLSPGGEAKQDGDSDAGPSSGSGGQEEEAPRWPAVRCHLCGSFNKWRKIAKTDKDDDNRLNHTCVECFAEQLGITVEAAKAQIADDHPRAAHSHARAARLRAAMEASAAADGTNTQPRRNARPDLQGPAAPDGPEGSTRGPGQGHGQQQAWEAASHADEPTARLEQAQRSGQPDAADASPPHPQGKGKLGRIAGPPRCLWQRYREPGTARLWFFKETTGEHFFADSPHPWRRLALPRDQSWWWNEDTNENFREEDCDGDQVPDEDAAKADATGWSLEELHLTHLKREVVLSGLVQRGTAETPSSVRYTGKAWEFQVVLERTTTDDKFGIAFRVDLSTRVPVVSQVKVNGMCARHNFEMQQFPEESSLHQTQIVPGDMVKVVNGFASVDEIKSELIGALVVHLRVMRPASSPEESLVAGTRGVVTALTAGGLLQ